MRAERNHIDILTLLAVLTLLAFSVGVVYSASATYALHRLGGSETMLGKHAVKVLIGIVAIFVFMQIDYHRYRRITKPVLLMTLGLLVVTLMLGGEVKGATRWLLVRGASVQPSEFAKFALVFHLCALMSVKKDHIREFKAGFVPMMVWIGSVTVLVLLQPNVSTGIMIVAISLVILFVGRVKLSHMALSFGAVLPLLAVYTLSAGYRMRRVMNFLAGSAEADGKSNYQLLQAIIGFGNGGLLGLGPGGSRQREGFLPESYGDFVYSIVGEEYGLVGSLSVLLLFLVIFLRGIRIARHARDDFGRYLAVGITSSITLYGLINAGVTLGILPTTGLPMPFVSYGGTSIIVSCAAVGVLLNISSQTDLHPRLIQAPDGVRPIEPVHTPAVGDLY